MIAMSASAVDALAEATGRVEGIEKMRRARGKHRAVRASEVTHLQALHDTRKGLAQ